MCPQGGCPAHTVPGPDSFRCPACQTEYYPDSHNVTVTVRQRYLPTPGGLPRRSPRLKDWAGPPYGTWCSVFDNA